MAVVLSQAVVRNAVGSPAHIGKAVRSAVRDHRYRYFYPPRSMNTPYTEEVPTQYGCLPTASVYKSSTAAPFPELFL